MAQQNGLTIHELIQEVLSSWWLLGRRRPCHDALSRDPGGERAEHIREKVYACSQRLPTFSFKNKHSKQENLLRDAMSLSVNLVVCQDGVFE